jgi:hypothetical protein
MRMRKREEIQILLQIQTKNTMNKEQAITTAKQFRKNADELLQRMKAHRIELMSKNIPQPERFEEIGEVIAQHTLSIRDLEYCIMRQGMALKYIGTPNPYPESKNPSSTVVEPTADGLKM